MVESSGKAYGDIILVNDSSSNDQIQYNGNKIIFHIPCSGLTDSDIFYQFDPKTNILIIRGQRIKEDIKFSIDKIYRIGSNINKVHAKKIIDGILRLELIINNHIEFESDSIKHGDVIK